MSIIDTLEYTPGLMRGTSIQDFSFPPIPDENSTANLGHRGTYDIDQDISSDLMSRRVENVPSMSNIFFPNNIEEEIQFLDEEMISDNNLFGSLGGEREEVIWSGVNINTNTVNSLMSTTIDFIDFIDSIDSTPSHSEQSSKTATPQKRKSSDITEDSQSIKPSKGNWTEEEHKNLENAHERYKSAGNKWEKVSADVGTRNALQCKSHWQKFQNKQFQEKNINIDELNKSQRFLVKQNKEITKLGGLNEKYLQQITQDNMNVLSPIDMNAVQSVIQFLFLDIENQMKSSQDEKGNKSYNGVKKRRKLQ